MNYCIECGSPLHPKYLENEGEIPFCERCGEFRFPVFNTAVSMIVFNPSKDRILLIKQYGRDRFILTAGYVNKGENAENAVSREIAEELGARVVSMRFNRSRYFEKSNTLILNFTAVLESEELNTNYEIDSFEWFSVADAQKNIADGSLAQFFLNEYINENEGCLK
jgi:NAD+ diphosphatase